MKVLILVLTCLNNETYSHFYKKQNETWNSIDTPDVSTFFFINGGDKKKIDGHFIINDLPETTITVGYKTINAFEQTLNWDYDYIYHTNSSSYVDKKSLYEWLLDKPRTKYYSGQIIGYRSGIFASGCGFTLSKDVVKLILENQERWEINGADDATLGLLLGELGIEVQTAPRYDIVSTDDINTIPDDFFHYRCRTDDRVWDAEFMEVIHGKKLLKK